MLLPEIRIRENFRLKPSQYAIFINGIKADEADIPADKLMALSQRNLRRDRRRAGERPGVRDAGYLDSARAESEGAEYGYQVIDSASVIATHAHKICAQLYS
ncbi:FHIPEP family type III secretion protein [Escherichia coli]